MPAGFARDSEYDAWNRLITSQKKASLRPGAAVRAMVLYFYDALGRMICQGQVAEPRVLTEFYHSAGWQTIAEKTWTSEGGGQVVSRREHVWSLAYVDAMVVSEAQNADGTRTARYAPTQDASWNVTALLELDGTAAAPADAAVVRRYIYQPYGQATALFADGLPFHPRLNVLSPLERPKLGDFGWRHFHQGGYLCLGTLGAPGDGLYHFRHRSYDPLRGQWLQRDPLGTVDSLNLHEYLGSSPINYLDPSGEMFITGVLAILAAAAAVALVSTPGCEQPGHMHEGLASGYRAHQEAVMSGKFGLIRLMRRYSRVARIS